jgi:CubicO group peptidase (beta-lactamase class C family)
MKNFLLVSLFVGASLALVTRVFKRTAAAPVTNQSPYDAIDAYVERERRHLKIPGISLAIVHGDQIAHLRGFGKARPNAQAPLPQTPFYIGSLTKSFTALAVMQLREAGKIELDTPVCHYLPWYKVADPGASGKMTVRHLLNQTSGLPTAAGEIPLADFDNSPDAAAHQARALSTLVPTRPIGSAFEYSNANYNLLGLIIEAVSGQSYADYIQQHIFTPLKMSHSYTSQEEANQDGLALGHQYWFAIPVSAPNLPIPRGSLAAGFIISSAQDLARYMLALLNAGSVEGTSILSPDGISELFHGVAEVRVMGLSLGRYGMGWFVHEIGETKIIWHGGTLPHFGAYMALVPEQKKGIVLLFNACHHWMTPVLAEFGSGAAALLAGEPLPSQQFLGIVPWFLRGLILLPVFQIGTVVAALLLLHLWHLPPACRTASHVQGLAVLLPDILAALALLPVLGKRRGYAMLYMPDMAWTAMLCGSLAVAWSILRIGLFLRASKGAPA